MVLQSDEALEHKLKGMKKCAGPRSTRTSKCQGLKVRANEIVFMPIASSGLSKGRGKAECRIDESTHTHTHTHTHRQWINLLNWHLLFYIFL